MDTLKNLDFIGTLKGLLPNLQSAAILVIQVTIASFTLALVLGLLIAMGQLTKNKVLCKILGFIIEIMRGTPLMVQLVYIYYVVPLILSSVMEILGVEGEFKMSAVIAGIVGLGLNYGCLLSEVIRSSIESIDIGQTEASLALGFSKTQTTVGIILPQALRSAIPVFGNYLSTIIKDTSLLAYISVPELLMKTKSYTAQTFRTLESYTVLALIYLIITLPLSWLVKLLEKKLKR